MANELNIDPNTVVTITRQYGSGGRQVAEILAKKMGVRRYDRKVVAMAAENIGNGADFDDVLERSYNAPENCTGNIGDYAYERVPAHNRMYIEQAKVILGIAKEGGAVFLGRCADYILRDRPKTYSVFIYANDEFRAARARSDRYGDISLKDMDAVDRQREQYYAYYTGQSWGAPENYDIMINTGKLSLEAAADLILDYVRKRQGKE